MYCFMCGKEIAHESVFCSFCGAKIIRENLNDKKDVGSDDEGPNNDSSIEEVSVVKQKQQEELKKKQEYEYHEKIKEAERQRLKELKLVTQRKNKIKILIAAIVILLIACVGVVFGRMYLAKKHYNLAKEEIEVWFNWTKDGTGYQFRDGFATVEDNLNGIKEHFEKYVQYGGDSEDKLVKNAYTILYTYSELLDQGYRDISRDRWEECLSVAKLSTGNNKIDALTAIMNAECKAAVLCYDWDFQGAYEIAKPYEASLGVFVKDLYLRSFLANKLIKESQFLTIRTYNTVNEVNLFTHLAGVNNSEYPFIICQFEDSSDDFIGMYQNGYSFKPISLQMQKDIIIEKMTYGDKFVYSFDKASIDEMSQAYLDGKISFLNVIPETVSSETE